MIRSRAPRAMPCRASVTTVVGSLMIFFTAVLSTVIGRTGDARAAERCALVTAAGAAHRRSCPPERPTRSPRCGHGVDRRTARRSVDGLRRRRTGLGRRIGHGRRTPAGVRRRSGAAGAAPTGRSRSPRASRTHRCRPRTGSYPRSAIRSAERGAAARHQQPAAAEIDDVRAGLLRHRPEHAARRPDRRPAAGSR